MATHTSSHRGRRTASSLPTTPSCSSPSPSRTSRWTLTGFATQWIREQSAATPWFFFLSYFHVHTPLFVQRERRGRSKGGAFGDNVEELDDSVGAVLGAVDATGSPAARS